MESEILDIHSVEAGEFRPLLEAESRTWHEDLHWDYSASARLVTTCIEEKRLSGYALRQAGRIQGFCFFFLDGAKALIGDLYVEPGSAAVARSLPLLERSLDDLFRMPGIRRIEAQLPHFSYEQLNLCFRSRCFEGYVRQFMSKEIERPGHAPTSPRSSAGRASTLPGAFEIQPWKRSCDREATELLYQTYRHHVDAVINEQYGSLEGASRLIENIVYHRGCGEFLNRASVVAVHRSTRKLAGILGVTEVRSRTAHIPQIAVATEFQGVGVGGALLRTALSEVQNEGFREVSLTVTSLNEGAIRLYERLGFRMFRAFGAFAWQRP